MDEDLKTLLEEHRFRFFDVLVVALSMLGMGFALALLCGCTSVDLVKRYGLPKAYQTPFVVRGTTGELACVLYPDGHLDMKGRPELAVRVLIARLNDLTARSKADLANVKREMEAVQRELAVRTLELQNLRKLRAAKITE